VSFSVTGYLRALREAAGRVSAGQFDTRVEVLSGDELSELAIAFNRMSEELGRSTGRERAQEQARRNLVAAISHDLGRLSPRCEAWWRRFVTVWCGTL
jgi:nitrogen fixation/metabolism regulation signal transduction histidine kinase